MTFVVYERVQPSGVVSTRATVPEPPAAFVHWRVCEFAFSTDVPLTYPPPHVNAEPAAVNAYELPAVPATEYVASTLGHVAVTATNVFATGTGFSVMFAVKLTVHDVPFVTAH